MTKIDYKKEYLKQLKVNLALTLREIDDQNFTKKIFNWAEKFEYTKAT